MNSALKWKLIAGFLLVFIAGGATGVFVTMTIGHHFMFGPHPPGQAAQAMKNRLRWHLKLTDDQMTKISPIIEKSGAQLEQIRGDTGKKVRETIVQAHREISQYLTPEQQERLKQMEEHQRRWMHHRGGPPWRGRNAPPNSQTPAAESSAQP
jgi:Spy/CpxP family protein refolding chaperone